MKRENNHKIKKEQRCSRWYNLTRIVTTNVVLKASGLKNLLIRSGWLNAYGRSIAKFQRFIDMIVINGIFYALQPGINWTAGYINIPTVCIVFMVVAVVLPNAGIYRSYRHKTLNRMFQNINSTWISIICFVILALFLNKSSSNYSRFAISLWGIVCWLWLISTHICTRSYLKKLRRLGLNSRTILYWGNCEAAKKFSEQLSTAPWLGYRIVAWFSPVKNEKFYESAELPKCAGGINELRNWLEANKVDCIVFSDALIKELNKDSDDLISIFGNTCSRVLYAPTWSTDTMRFQADVVGEQYCVEVWGAKQTYDERVFKRIFDLFFSIAGVMIISPLLLLIAIAVKLSSRGPIIFKQKRCGLDGKVFECYKFRSMFVEEKHDNQILKQAVKGDRRVTRTGRILRRWSLDELPQLFNVIEGNMSLVGPRPHALEHDKYYRKLIKGYSQRHVYKPGMTGLAQVSGFRGPTEDISTMEERIKADLEYQREWSLLVDIEILFKTVLTVVITDAY